MPFPAPPQKPSLNPILLTVNVSNFISAKLAGDKQANNYTLWSEQMVCLIESHDLLGFIDGTLTVPPRRRRPILTTAAGRANRAEEDDRDDDNVVWTTDRLVKGWLLGSINNSVLRTVVKLPTARQVWLELEKSFKTSEPPAPPPPPPLPRVGPSSVPLLYTSIKDGNWVAVEKYMKENPKEITGTELTRYSDTPLLVAVKTGQSLPFIEKLVNMMHPDGLALTNKLGDTALHVVAEQGNIKAAELFVKTNGYLPNIWNRDKYVPVHLAARRGNREMTLYLLSVTNVDETSDVFKDIAGSKFLRFVVAARFHDVALCLVDRDPTLAWQHDQNYCPLKLLSEEPSAFPSGRNFNFRQKLIYSCVPMKLTEMPESLAALMKSPQRRSTNTFLRTYLELWKVLERLFPSVKDIRDQKVMHHHAPQLMKRLCSEISKCTDNRESTPIITGPFLDAARNGIDEMVKEILESFPQALYFVDDKKHSALHLAVMYRHAEVFKIFTRQIGEHKISMSITKDRWNNNILHSVGFRPKQDQLDQNSGPVLGMQQELHWYMKVEKFVTPLERKARNIDGKTPLALFNERHSDLVAEETQWMTSMATASSVVASLIATIAFAAAITVPGGNDEDSGLPIFSSARTFLFFVIFDAVALLSSITTVLSFLSIFTSRYAVIDFLRTLPKRLIIGQTSLLVSVASLMAAFSCSLYLIAAQQNPVILLPLIALASVPVILFFFLQVPPLINMIKSTYGRSIFD